MNKEQYRPEPADDEEPEADDVDRPIDTSTVAERMAEDDDDEEEDD